MLFKTATKSAKSYKLLKFFFAIIFFAGLLVVLRLIQVLAFTPSEINFQGKITDSNGVNVANGDYDFRVRIYDAASGGNELYNTDLLDIPVENGIFNLKFSPSNAALGASNTYLQVCFNADIAGSVNNDSLDGIAACNTGSNDKFDKAFTPRKKITSNPYSLMSKFLGSTNISADTSGNLTVGGNATITGTTTLNGQTYTWPSSQGSTDYVLKNNGSGTLSWAAVTSGTVTSITAGSGLSGGTITQSGTISLNTSNSNTWGALQTFNNGLTLGSTSTLSLTGTSNQVVFGSGVTGTLTWSPVTSSKVITLPNETGTVCTTGSVCTGYQASGSYLTSEVDGIIGNEFTNVTNTTLTRSGSGTAGAPYTVGLNLGNSNTWTALQTYNNGVTLGASSSLTLSAFTQGSVPYIGASGVLSQNNSAFFWDNTNTRLIIGSSSSDIGGGDLIASSGGIYRASASTNASLIGFDVVTGNFVSLASGKSGTGTALPLTLWVDGDEMMRLNNSGQILTGLTSASTFSSNVNFGVYDNAISLLEIASTTTGNTNYGQLLVRSDASNLSVASLSSSYTPVGINPTSGGTLEVSGSGGLSIGATNASGIIRFYTNTGVNERMRIAADGAVGVGTTTTTNAKFTVAGVIRTESAGATGGGFEFVDRTTGDRWQWYGLGTGTTGLAALFNGSTNVMTIAEGGNIAFGVNSTSGTTTLDIGGTANTVGVCHTGGNTATDNVTLVDCSGTAGADYMEMYPVASNATMGDIVAIGTNNVTTQHGETIKQLVKSNSQYQMNVIGIVSDINQAGDFNSIGYNINESDNPQPIALNGRVKVKITSINGNIEPGDLITTSNTPGVGMKATSAGFVVGKALESYSNADTNAVGYVMVYINNSYYNPSSTTITSSSDWTLTGDTLSSDFNVAVNGNFGVSGSVTSNSINSQTLAINTNKLTIDANGNLVSVGSIQSNSVTAAVLNATNATITNLKVTKLSVDQTVLNPTTASGVIPAGTQTIVVPNTNVTANSKIFVTITSDSGDSLRVIQKVNGTSFTVKLNTTATSDVTFDYWIVGE